MERHEPTAATHPIESAEGRARVAGGDGTDSPDRSAGIARSARVAQLRAAWSSAALRPVDIASLAAFRILFGAVMCAGIVRFLATGWIAAMYTEPHWFFHYPGFSWVEPWPGWGMYLHYAVLAVLALGIALGAWHRVVTIAFVVGFAYTQLIDITNYLNHHYLVVLLGALLAALPANAAWSIDARRRPALRRDCVPAWMVWLVRFQVGAVYAFAGLAKAKLDWLGHAQPLNLWLAARTETPVIGAWFAEPWFAYAMAWAGFAFDSTIAIWLSWRRTRLLAYGAVIAFHGLTGALFNIGMFPVIMTSSALIWFSPSWPRHALAWLCRARARLRRALAWLGRARSRLRRSPSATAPAPPPPPPRLDRAHRPAPAHDRGRSTCAPRPAPEGLAPPPRGVCAIIAIYVAVQLALPLRHYVYPGDVLWNEDGMRFAWHVLIREKLGKVGFSAVFADGKRLEIPARNYLTPRQDREMSGQPDLILQLAHAIGRDLAARGYRRFEIHATALVSLNGRAPVAMIDPAIDLLAIRDLGPRSWVLPAPAVPPPRVQPAR